MTKSKMQEEFHGLMGDLLHKSNYQVNVGDFAKVVKYDKARHVADVLPLVSDTDGMDTPAIINECPVLYPCYAVDELRKEIKGLATKSLAPIKERPTMKTGATVFIVFNNRDLDNFEKSSYTKASERMHSINDAVVVGVLE